MAAIHNFKGWAKKIEKGYALSIFGQNLIARTKEI